MEGGRRALSLRHRVGISQRPQGFRTHRKPAVWVYRKKGAPNPDLDNPDYAAIVEQWDKLKRIFAAFTNPDGSLAGGINQYETQDDFRQQFEQHLRDRLDKLLETLPATNALQRVMIYNNEGLAKPIKASGISGQNGQKKKITCPV